MPRKKATAAPPPPAAHAAPDPSPDPTPTTSLAPVPAAAPAAHAAPVAPLSSALAEPGLPDLSEQQVKFLMYRLASDKGDYEACEATETPPAHFLEWKTNDAAFKEVWTICKHNKREAVRLLGAQLMPRAMRTLYEIMSSGTSEKTRLMAVQLLLRTQGLLIDRQATVSPDALRDLITQLREAHPIEIINVTPR